MANTNNKIRIFAPQATTEYGADKGLILNDSAWDSNTKRLSGEIQNTGASSVRYNTALRQSSFMSYVLAEALALKGSDVKTTNLSGTTTLEQAAEALAAILAGYLIKDGEVSSAKLGTDAVIESKIKAGAVTEPKLGTGAVTNTKLGSKAVTTAKLANLITTGSFTHNGQTVTLTQGAGNGFSIGLSGTPTQATRAQYASEDTSKGTIETRLSNLGFRQGNMTWAGIAFPNSLRRQGNYIIQNQSQYSLPSGFPSGGLTEGAVVGVLPTYFKPLGAFSIPIIAVSSNNIDAGACIELRTNSSNGNLTVSSVWFFGGFTVLQPTTILSRFGFEVAPI